MPPSKSPSLRFGDTLIALGNEIAESDALDADTKLRWLKDLERINEAHSARVTEVLDAAFSAVRSAAT